MHGLNPICGDPGFCAQLRGVIRSPSSRQVCDSRLRGQVVVGKLRVASISRKANAGKNPLTGVELQPVLGARRALIGSRFGSRSALSPMISKLSRYSRAACFSSSGGTHRTNSPALRVAQRMK